MEKQTLLETYSKRISVAESVATKVGVEFDNSRKMTVAMVLDNTNKFLNEAFSNSVGTQRADLGAWKKFCLNLTTVALPTLIAPEVVIVNPMSSFSGYITYVRYTSGTNKGETKQGDVFNDPFRLGKVDVNFTGSAVVESHKVTSEESTEKYVEVRAMWTPVADVKKVMVGGVEKKIIKTGTAGAGEVLVEISPTDKLSIGFTFGDAIAVDAEVKFAYLYDNEVIPQNDLPTVNAEIKSLPLVAKARRVAVYYSQIAAFQAKQDYGFDLGDQLAEKACGQMAYEIDTEIVGLIDTTAGAADIDLHFNKRLPVGVSKAQHYEGFTEIIEIGKQKIYDRTKRFAPNYMLIASNILPVLSFVPGFKAASNAKINGPYLAGTLNGLKVFVSPAIAAGRFVLGVNGDDFMSSVAVYAPYMAIVPTQLLGYADGGMSQGFSTLYALEVLNDELCIAGTVAEDAAVAGATAVIRG